MKTDFLIKIIFYLKNHKQIYSHADRQIHKYVPLFKMLETKHMHFERDFI